MNTGICFTETILKLKISYKSMIFFTHYCKLTNYINLDYDDYPKLPIKPVKYHVFLVSISVSWNFNI